MLNGVSWCKLSKTDRLPDINWKTYQSYRDNFCPFKENADETEGVVILTLYVLYINVHKIKSTNSYL